MRLKDRIALITGASRGIGAAVAKRFAAEGAHVILVARTVGGLEEVDDAIQQVGGTATLVPLDLMEYAKIDELGGLIAQRYGKLDILVGNAGVLGTLSPLAHITPKTWEKVMALNFTANWRLIRSFDALLQAAPAGRAMFVTSGVTKRIHPYWGAYASSKAALEMLVKTYAAENATTSVRANLIDPGAVATKMYAAAMPGADLEQISKPEDITELFVKLAEVSCTFNGQVLNAYE
jgi:NAD(P)-dependent dehydrogenase (short-subunit alcohol dehydrogenase family)